MMYLLAYILLFSCRFVLPYDEFKLGITTVFSVCQSIAE